MQRVRSPRLREGGIVRVRHRKGLFIVCAVRTVHFVAFTYISVRPLLGPLALILFTNLVTF